MRTPWRTLLLTCVVAATATGAAATAVTPIARAQSSPSGPTGDSGGSSCPTTNPPNELVLAGGTPQTAQLETAFAAPLQVALANTNGCPITTQVTGTPITYNAPLGGPSAVFAASGSGTMTVGTDASGSASAQMVTADATAGSYAVTASSAYGSVSFSLTNTAAGIPATIAPLEPASQHATVGRHYTQPLAVRVLDAAGNPIAGVNVAFNLGAGGAGAANGPSSSGAASASASFDDGSTQAAETTNAAGVATSPGFSANAASGAFTATATVAHVTEPARFALDNLAARPHTISPVGSSRLYATVGTRYPRRLRARIRTANGHPVAGATVTFLLGSASSASATSAGGPGATFTGGASQATAKTGAQGIATSPPLAANHAAGSFTATATAGGASGAALFRLHNRAGAPAAMTVGVGAAQSTTTGARFAIPLAVTVTDSQGNRAAGVPVTFTAPSSGPGGSFPRGDTKVIVRTNSSGVAVAPPLTANEQQGGYIVTATVQGARPVAFALVNTSA
jgi:adhesin/invasin